MRRMIAIALVSAGCKGLLGIDDEIALVDAPIDAVADAGDVDAPLVACPSSYTPGDNGSSYRFSETSADWLTAATECASDTGGARTHLAVPATATERALVADLALAGRMWIGMSNRAGELAWVTAEPSPVPADGDEAWQLGEPDGLTQECVWMKDARFVDEGCAQLSPYVCECDTYPDDPSRY